MAAGLLLAGSGPAWAADVSAGSPPPAEAPAAPPAAPHWPLPTNAEIRQILIDRIDVQRQSEGIVVGIIDAHGRRVVSYGVLDKGDPKPVGEDTMFEIGSMTKVFTSLILADMVQRHEVALDDPVAKYLPRGVKVPERGGKQITLIDLATHTSGLPPLPTNFAPKDASNPYADYTVDQLYQFLSGYTLTRDIGSKYEYSNLGGGLLGRALSQRAGLDYESLIKARITGPLGMDSTAIALTPAMKARLATGHSANLEPTPNWDLPTLAGAGALRSDADDMLTFLAAELGYKPTPLVAAMKAQIEPRRPTGRPNLEVALGWHIFDVPAGQIVWHNGGTGGYRTFMGFDAKAGVGVVVLSNTSTQSGVDDIGVHLLTGAPLLKPRPPVEHHEIVVNPEVLKGHAGRYQLAPNVFMDITFEDGRLFAQLTGQAKYEVFPETPARVFWKVVDAQADFAVDEKGHTVGLIMHQSGRDLPAPRVDAPAAGK